MTDWDGAQPMGSFHMKRKEAVADEMNQKERLTRRWSLNPIAARQDWTNGSVAYCDEFRFYCGNMRSSATPTLPLFRLCGS